MINTASEETLFSHALQSLQAGQFGTTVEICNKLIDSHKSRAETLHILALAYRGLGDIIQAEKIIKRAIKKARKDSSVLNSYGLILIDRGNFRQATQVLKNAIDLDNQSAAAYTNLAKALSRINKADEAKHSYFNALRVDPSFSDAFVDLALLLHSTGKLSDLEVLLKNFLNDNAPSAASYFVEGYIALKNGNLVDAESLFRQGRELEPGSRPILVNLGVVLTKQSKITDAIRLFEEALTLFPGDVDIQLNLANALKYEAPSKARHYVEAALLKKPEDLNSLDLLGFSFLLEGNLEYAIDAFDRALAQDPNYNRAFFHKACALFLAGRLQEAWPFYLKWYGDSGLNGSPVGLTLERANERDLLETPTLIWTDQGIGDEILQLSMVADLVQRKIPIQLSTSERIVPLVTRSFPSINCLNHQELEAIEVSTLDLRCQIPAGALGSIVRLNWGSFPGRDAFLRADKKLTSALKKKYRKQSNGKPVIGLSWRSNNVEFGNQKSLPLEHFKPFFHQNDFTFLDLQYGNTDKEIESLPSTIQRRLIRDVEIDPLKDLDSFAAQILATDLVITTSNSTAHLSGALGQETWVLIPRPGPGWLWYWFADRQDSPWYPTSTLFRQSQDGNWGPPIQDIARRLDTFFDS